MRHLLLFVLLISLVSCGASPIIGYAVINGQTETELIDPVNVWDDYQARKAIVARVHHGDRVGIVRREGNGVLIETSNGVRGWLTHSFLKDVK